MMAACSERVRPNDGVFKGKSSVIIKELSLVAAAAAEEWLYIKRQCSNLNV